MTGAMDLLMYYRQYRTGYPIGNRAGYGHVTSFSAAWRLSVSMARIRNS